jgi:hypothetical protein
VTENEIIGAIVSVTGIMLSVVGMAVKTTRAISKSETELRSDMDAQVDNLQRDIARLERDAIARGDTYRQEFGETAAALRTKIHEVEVFSRDHFISKDTFSATVGRIEKMFENFGDRLERRFDKIDERFDKLAD